MKSTTMREYLNSRLAQRMKQPVRRVAARMNLDVVPLVRPDTEILQRLFVAERIELLVDVGANQGQYAMHMRALGYSGAIISYEPGADAFGRLQRNALRDESWSVRATALGSATGLGTLHLSANSVSSSLLPMTGTHLAAAPESRVVAMESVPVSTLDAELEGSASLERRTWIKIDTQGFELEVLRGAVRSLATARVVQVELSLTSLYEGQPSYLEVLRTLDSAGLRIIDLRPGMTDPATGHLLQCDGIAVRG